MAAAKLTSLDPVIQDLANADPPFVEADKFDMNHVPRMMILSINNSKMGGWVKLLTIKKRCVMLPFSLFELTKTYEP